MQCERPFSDRLKLGLQYAFERNCSNSNFNDFSIEKINTNSSKTLSITNSISSIKLNRNKSKTVNFFRKYFFCCVLPSQ